MGKFSQIKNAFLVIYAALTGRCVSYRIYSTVIKVPGAAPSKYQGQPLVSPDLAHLIEKFIACLPAKIESLIKAAQQQVWDTIKDVAHQ